MKLPSSSLELLKLVLNRVNKVNKVSAPNRAAFCLLQLSNTSFLCEFLTAAAAVGRDVSKSLRINSHASIFTAELVALNLSLDIIRRSIVVINT